MVPTSGSIPIVRNISMSFLRENKIRQECWADNARAVMAESLSVLDVDDQHCDLCVAGWARLHRFSFEHICLAATPGTTLPGTTGRDCSVETSWVAVRTTSGEATAPLRTECFPVSLLAATLCSCHIRMVGAWKRPGTMCAGTLLI